ncbi:MAG: PTS transporter subunit EIIC [Treponema sp.]|nr:PTS transporter subunit EIIC [Treponema sp.]
MYSNNGEVTLGSSFVEKAQQIAGKVQGNRWLGVLSRNMAAMIGVLLTGAILSLINGLPFGAGYTGFLQTTGIGPLLTAIINVCNMVAVFMCLSLGYGFAKEHGDNPFQGAMLTIMLFLILTPLQAMEGGIFINTSWLGAQGVFSAMFCAIIGTLLFSKILKRGIKIKMPEMVPEFVSKPFEAVVPVFLTAIPFIVLRAVFENSTFGSFHQFIYSMVALPLLGLGNSFPAHLAALLVACVLWWMGVHGTLVVFSVMAPILGVPAAANFEAYTAGQPLPFMLSMMTFFVAIQFMGGPGCMFGLYINMLFAKSARYKALGKVAFAPGMFNIIEPVIYGFPMVLNPVMGIPFIATPLIVYTIMFILMNIGLVGIPVIRLTVMTLPGPVAGFLLGGGISLGIFLIIACAASIIIYFPFFKVCDLNALKEERAAVSK